MAGKPAAAPADEPKAEPGELGDDELDLDDDAEPTVYDVVADAIAARAKAVSPSVHLTDGETITLKGEGGDVFAYDVPAAGTGAREIFDYQLSKGIVTVHQE